MVGLRSQAHRAPGAASTPPQKGAQPSSALLTPPARELTTSGAQAALRGMSYHNHTRDLHNLHDLSPPRETLPHLLSHLSPCPLQTWEGPEGSHRDGPGRQDTGSPADSEGGLGPCPHLDFQFQDPERVSCLPEVTQELGVEPWASHPAAKAPPALWAPRGGARSEAPAVPGLPGPGPGRLRAQAPDLPAPVTTVQAHRGKQRDLSGVSARHLLLPAAWSSPARGTGRLRIKP